MLKAACEVTVHSTFCGPLHDFFTIIVVFYTCTARFWQHRWQSWGNIGTSRGWNSTSSSLDGPGQGSSRSKTQIQIQIQKNSSWWNKYKFKSGSSRPKLIKITNYHFAFWLPLRERKCWGGRWGRRRGWSSSSSPTESKSSSCHEHEFAWNTSTWLTTRTTTITTTSGIFHCHGNQPFKKTSL